MSQITPIAFTVQQAATMLSCSTRKIHLLLESGKLWYCGCGELKRIPLVAITALVQPPSPHVAASHPQPMLLSSLSTVGGTNLSHDAAACCTVENPPPRKTAVQQSNLSANQQ